MSAAFTHTAPGPLPISPFLHGKQSHTCLAASFSILKSGASDMVGGCCCWEDTQLKTKTKTREMLLRGPAKHVKRESNPDLPEQEG